MRTMKILYIITSLEMGGAEKLVVDMLLRLREKGHEVELLTFSGKRTPLYQKIEQEGVKIHHFGVNAKMYNPMNVLKLASFLKHNRYDIVHTHNTAPQLFAAIASVLCSVVLCTTEHNTYNRRRNWKWYRPIDKWMYSRYKKVICISDSTEENLRKSIDCNSDKICTIYNGIDFESYDKASPIAKDSITPYINRKVIAMVAGFRYQKDQETLIRAMSYVPKDVELWLIGDGERRTIIEQCVKEKGLENRVRLLGIRNDIPSILKTVDIVVQSSHWEGFGLAAVEGMAAGKPVVASNVAGLSQVVSNAGVLFPLGDDKALADILNKLLTDYKYYNTVKGRCVKRAHKFDISKMVYKYCQVYQSLLEK